MVHARDQIRDAVLAAVTGLTTTGSKAFASRVHPITDAEMPCILVFTRNEESAPINMGLPRTIARQLTVMVEGYVKQVTGYDDKLDKISKEVEVALYNTHSLGSTIQDIFLTSTEIKLAGDAERPVAVVSMSWNVKYQTRENDPETII